LEEEVREFVCAVLLKRGMNKATKVREPNSGGLMSFSHGKKDQKEGFRRLRVDSTREGYTG